MMKNNALNLMQKLDFSFDAQKELLSAFNIILESPPLSEKFLGTLDLYDSTQFDFVKMLDDIKLLAQNADICEYTAYMLFLICLAPKLHKRYVQKGISDDIFYDSMSDLKYKLDECRLVQKKVGTFVPTWYKGFFEMKIFALGRLQFEIKHTWFDFVLDGIEIPKGTKVLSVHIPRTGTRLDYNLVIDSYKRATEFFKDEFDGDIIFICDSWMFYPWNRTVFKEGSNLAKFYDDFTVVRDGEYQNYNETWRLFDCLYDGNINKLPNDTSLRRAYIERIKNNQPTGYGTAAFIYKK